MSGALPPPKPLPIKERISVVFVEHGEVDMLDGAFVVVDASGLRLKVVRKMYAAPFDEEPPERRSVEPLRGIAGARVRRTDQRLTQQFGVKWIGRDLGRCGDSQTGPSRHTVGR